MPRQAELTAFQLPSVTAMLHRTVITAIVSFWLVMVGLYVRLEVFPESMPSWMAVPVSHVVDLVLRSSDSSTLAIHQGGERIGTLYVRGSHPKNGDGSLPLLLNGELTLRLPGAPQRLTFRSRVDVSPGTNAIESLEFALRLRQPELEFRLDYDQSGGVTYKLTGAGGELLQSGGGTTPAELLAATPLAAVGVSYERVRNMARDVRPPTAHRATARLAKESIPVYRLIVPHGQSLESQIDVSQLGRILRVTTPFGVTLLAEGIDL